MIDYYGVTFDHLVPVNDTNPKVLQINIVEIEDDAGVYAIQHNKFVIDPADYIGKQVLGAPRCCSTRKGTTDRKRINNAVMRGWETKCEWEGTGRGAGNEFRVKWSLGIRQQSSVRSVSSLKLLVGVKSFISCTNRKTQNTSVYQASLTCQC